MYGGSLISCCANFSLSSAIRRVQRCFSFGFFAAGVNSLQAGMLARARAYSEAVEQVRLLGDSAMANAAGADLVPAGILADDIDDHGGDASALRDAFAA